MRKILSLKQLFYRTYMKVNKNWCAFKTKGAIAPSSKFLVNRMVSKIDFNQNINILQLGHGKGVFTKLLVKKINQNSTITIFEIDKKSKQFLLEDQRINFINDSAEKISDYFKDKKFKYIISTLPFASLPKKVSNNIFKEIHDHLELNGKFLQFQYSLISKKKITNLFNIKPKIDFELLNIPPAFIYEVEYK